MPDKKNRDNAVCFFHLKIYTKTETSKFELSMAARIHMSIIAFHWAVCSYDVFWCKDVWNTEGKLNSCVLRWKAIKAKTLKRVFCYHYG